jgi:hypothetical protein
MHLPRRYHWPCSGAIVILNRFNLEIFFKVAELWAVSPTLGGTSSVDEADVSYDSGDTRVKSFALITMFCALALASGAEPSNPSGKGASSEWRPFEHVVRPQLPEVKNAAWVRNPIDTFVAAEHQARGLVPRPEAAKGVLLRRIYFDLIGLSPTPEERAAFLADESPDAYEHVVDKLLADSRYGERWGRHWMDIWRYSDWSGGNQIRDSKPHIWRWRDWIIESLNENKGYNQMLLEMLAADELAPGDTNALRATGFLVRNYKMLSREQWLEDTVKHTSQAFLGITMGCAKCHDHKFDPISQEEYYEMRAIFEPHQVRTDRIPGQLDTARDGLVRVYDVNTNPPTYLFIRGDERKPDTNRLMKPNVPHMLGGHFEVEPVGLPKGSAFPDKRPFVIEDIKRAAEEAVAEAKNKLKTLNESSPSETEKIKEEELLVSVAEAKRAATLAVLQTEELEEKKDSAEWAKAAAHATWAQRMAAFKQAESDHYTAQTKTRHLQEKVDQLSSAKDSCAPEAKESDRKQLADATKQLEDAKKKEQDASKKLAEARTQLESEPTTAFKPRDTETFPDKSTGRRLAFARWVANEQNPLTARVAMNHIWLRHFGTGIVPNPADFGANGKPAINPKLLDWLAAEFMSTNWNMKAMHRLIVTSSTYRMASTPDEADAKIDPDNTYLWRSPSRRMEAEVVRDNLLHVSGDLDPAMGGPDIDNNLGLTSKRRSIYLRLAAEKEVEFLKVFDGPAVTECYVRHPSVVPQQALALANSEVAVREAGRLAQRLSSNCGDAEKFVQTAFGEVLARSPKPDEEKLCGEFLESETKKFNESKARQNLVLVLFNHNDFITIR